MMGLSLFLSRLQPVLPEGRAGSRPERGTERACVAQAGLCCFISGNPPGKLLAIPGFFFTGSCLMCAVREGGNRVIGRGKALEKDQVTWLETQ